MNVDDLVDKVNEKYGDKCKYENIKIHITPLHLEPYYIVDNQIILNFFKIFFDENDNAIFEDKPIKEYIFDKICEMIEK